MERSVKAGSGAREISGVFASIRAVIAVTAAWAGLAFFGACADKSPTGGTPVTSRIPFETSAAGLPEAKPSRVIEARHGDTVRLAVTWVAKWIAGHKVRMLGYDGSIPGPTLKVPQGATVTLLLENRTSLPTSLHSHGVRLDWKEDGMPGISHPPLDSGQSHAYTLRFPDAGLYWYHPHVREDYGMELGLYGNYWVTPADSGYWPPVHREVLLMLDDVALEGGAIRPFYRNLVDYTLMGRFGNVFLVNGDTAFTMRVRNGEVIRFLATNAASARVFNLETSPVKGLNVVGADNGRYEHSTMRESDIIAPSERLIFQILFKKDMGDDDTVRLYHKYEKQGRFMEDLLGTFIYDPDTARPNLESSMETVTSAPVSASIDSFRVAFDKAPDRILEMTGTMDMTALAKKAHDPENTDYMGIEWFDEMGTMSSGSHEKNTRWILRDEETGKENHQIDWSFAKGEKVLIRVHNDPYAVHPMPHPIHFHGQRFLVVREQGKPQKDNLVWRDSYLIGRGFTVDLLLDASNPGSWMVHCHIPEHLGAQMMGHFKVGEAGPARVDHPWSLSLRPDTGARAFVFKGDTAFTAKAAGPITGRLVGYDPAVFGNTLAFRRTGLFQDTVVAALDAQGGFSFPATDLLERRVGPILLQAIPTVTVAGHRAVPHRMRLSLNRAEPLPWSLDLDLAGEASFTALRADTSADGAFEGEFSGKVNGYDPARLQDTVFFVNVQYPKESTARAPLAADGSFRFDAFDVLGGTDGSIFIDIGLRAKNPAYAPDPETIRLVCNRVLP